MVNNAFVRHTTKQHGGLLGSKRLVIAKLKTYTDTKTRKPDSNFIIWYRPGIIYSVMNNINFFYEMVKYRIQYCKFNICIGIVKCFDLVY